MKKIWIRYTLFFGLGFTIFITLLSMSKNPEIAIEGEWSEKSWEYVKVDTNKSKDFATISNYVKDLIGENVIIHKAEKWKFFPNGKLILEGEGYSKELSWCIKGRGNILELKYDNEKVEHYNLTELSKNKLVLNFETNTHTRGIARLTFVKTNNYVTKIQQ